MYIGRVLVEEISEAKVDCHDGRQNRLALRTMPRGPMHYVSQLCTPILLIWVDADHSSRRTGGRYLSALHHSLLLVVLC